MSIDYNIHVGPFVRCPRLMRTSHIKHRCCSNQTCTSRGRDFSPEAFYCQYCGDLIEDRYQDTQVDAVELDRLFGDKEPFRQAICSHVTDAGLFVHLVPNVSRGKPRKWEVENDSVVLLFEGSVTDEIQWLRIAFANELKVLALAYGAAEVLWGVLAWST